MYSPVLSTIRVTCPAYLNLDLITRIIFPEEYRSLSSSLCSFLCSLAISSLLGPNILLSTLFSNTLSLRWSRNARDQVSHPNKTTTKITFLCILIFIFLEIKLEDKRFCSERHQAVPEFDPPRNIIKIGYNFHSVLNKKSVII